MSDLFFQKNHNRLNVLADNLLRQDIEIYQNTESIQEDKIDGYYLIKMVNLKRVFYRALEA